MLTIKDIWAKKNTFTSKASDIARTLSLSGLAVVWIFRTPGTGGSGLAPVLIWISVLLVLALFVDLIQYLVGAYRTGLVAEDWERKIAASNLPPDHPVTYPLTHAIPMNRLWAIKMGLVVSGWAALATYVGIQAVSAGLPALTR